jgi:hypothetical protein
VIHPAQNHNRWLRLNPTLLSVGLSIADGKRASVLDSLAELFDHDYAFKVINIRVVDNCLSNESL